ncbi:MAG: fimbrillin family protein [Bacteroidales bacterium]|nr:fimbrillin family protein [Candidatus Cacconaster merdequi]
MIALLTLSAMVSCGKITSTETLAEIAVRAVNCIETKGYVTGESLQDSGVPRDIHLSAYNTTLAQPYFLDMTFKNPAGDSWTNHNGDVHTPLYWPQDSRLSFLAYSAGTSAPKAAWSLSGNTSRVVLDVTPESLQDDILFAVADDCTSELSPISLDFRHSQAWIEFQISAPISEITSFLGVTINNVRTSGILTITDNYGLATSSWDFSSSMPSNHLLTPDWSAISSPSSSVSLSILLPQQPCCSFTFHFKINGVDRAFPCDLSGSEYWYSSVHYTYKANVIGGEVSGFTKSSAEGDDISCHISTTEQNWD